MAHVPKYSVICQGDSSDASNINRAIWLSVITKRMNRLGFSTRLSMTGTPGIEWARAYGITPFFLPAGDDIRDCEVLFRAFSPGNWPPRPGLPHQPHVVDFAFRPSDGSGDSDHVIAIYPNDPPGAFDARTIFDSALAPIPDEVYETRRGRIPKHAVVFLGTDPNDRLSGVVSAIAGGGYTASGVLLPSDPTPATVDLIREPLFWLELRKADVAVCSPGALHQTAGALGVPVMVLANTAGEDSRMLSAMKTGLEHVEYLGLITSITDAQIQTAVRGLMNTLDAAADAKRRAMGIAGRVVVTSDGTMRICSWITRALLGAGRSDPYNVQGFDTLTTGRTLPPPVEHSSLIDAVAAWRLDETSGTRFNEVDGSALGDLTETGTVGQEPTGVKYQAATMAASASNVLATPAALVLTADRTFSFWFRKSATTSEGVIRNVGLPDFFDLRTTFDNLQLTVNGTGPTTGTATLTNGTFYHLRLDYEHSTGAHRVFVNGVLDIALTAAHTDPTPDILVIGPVNGLGVGTFTFDEAYAWDRLLTAQESASLLTKFYPFQQS